MAYRTEGDLIVLTMSRSDYEILLMMLGGAAAIAMEDRGPLAFNEALRFVNRVNQGNPNWIPYEVDHATQERQESGHDQSQHPGDEGQRKAP